MIRNATESDAGAISRIYNYYIRNTWITFEEEDVSTEEMAGRITRTKENYPWIVWEEDGQVLGYCYADRWKERASYRFTVEITIYLDKNTGGRGIGKALYSKMLPLLKEAGFRSVVSCISIPNKPSITLHEKFGFNKVGIFHQSGYKFDTWIDVGFWELLL